MMFSSAKLVRLRGQKSHSPSYVDYRSETNAIILLDMVVHYGKNSHKRNKEREGNLKLECG
jgi:hypothetical protein